MTGPEHYAEAERLLAEADKATERPVAETRALFALVHAQLSTTAAIVDCSGRVDREWRDAVPHPYQSGSRP